MPTSELCCARVRCLGCLGCGLLLRRSWGGDRRRSGSMLLKRLFCPSRREVITGLISSISCRMCCCTCSHSGQFHKYLRQPVSRRARHGGFRLRQLLQLGCWLSPEVNHTICMLNHAWWKRGCSILKGPRTFSRASPQPKASSLLSFKRLASLAQLEKRQGLEAFAANTARFGKSNAACNFIISRFCV